MELEHSKREYTVVKWDRLEQFIHDVTGVRYDIVSGEEFANDMVKSYSVYPEDEKYYIDEWEEFKTGKLNRNYLLHSILVGLHHEGKIEPGHYLVSVCW